MLFRKETRWPGYYFRADKPALDEQNWHVFANCRYDPKSNEWEVMSRPVLHVFSSQPKEPAKVSGEVCRARREATGGLPL